MTTDELVVHGGRPLRGRLRVPGDKGISHRALLAGALADGVTTIDHLAPGDDVARTAGAIEALGARVEREPDRVVVNARGDHSLQEPAEEIDCGNSGTTMRMLAGLLAGRSFRSVLTGDESLTRRPMGRVIRPLRALGAHIDGADDGTRAPLVIEPSELHGARVALDVASGQVKTALILAGLRAHGTTEIVEPAPSRDHTERLFAAIGAPVERVDDRTTRVRAGVLHPFELDVPGDPSSAAFLVVAALISPGSELVLEDVLLNPGRLAFVEILRAMGAHIGVRPHGERLGEPVGDLEIRSSPLHGATIHCTEPIVDEVPALAVAGAFADGITEIRDAAELRVKESDRIATLEQELTELGVGIEATRDGLLIRGGQPRPSTLKSHGDHRIALAAAVAANAVAGESRIRGWKSVEVSYPGFAADLASLTQQ